MDSTLHFKMAWPIIDKTNKKKILEEMRLANNTPTLGRVIFLTPSSNNDFSLTYAPYHGVEWHEQSNKAFKIAKGWERSPLSRHLTLTTAYNQEKRGLTMVMPTPIDYAFSKKTATVYALYYAPLFPSIKGTRYKNLNIIFNRLAPKRLFQLPRELFEIATSPPHSPYAVQRARVIKHLMANAQSH